METNSYEELAKLVTSLFFKKEFNLLEMLPITTIHCERTYLYHFTLIKVKSSSNRLLLKFIFKLESLVPENLKKFIDYSNQVTKLGWFYLAGHNIFYTYTLKEPKTFERQSKLAIFHQTLSKMNAIFSNIIPAFQVLSIDLKEKRFESMIESCKVKKKLNSNYLDFKLRYSELKGEEINGFNSILYKDLSFVLKILKYEELVNFFLPDAKINLSRSWINFSKSSRKLSKVFPLSSTAGTISNTLRNIDKSLGVIGYRANFELMIQDLFKNESNNYQILAKQPLLNYIHPISNNNPEFSLKESLQLKNLDQLSLSGHFFKNIDTFLSSVTSVKTIEITSNDLKRFLQFKSLNSSNLISFQGLFKGRDGKYFIITEPFESGSFFNKFKQCSCELLDELSESIRQLANLIFLCGKKGIHELSLSAECLDFTSNQVKLVPSFKKISKQFRAPEEQKSENLKDDEKARSDFYRLGLMIIDLLFKDECIDYMKKHDQSPENVDCLKMIDPSNEDYSELQEELQGKYKNLLPITQSLVLEDHAQRIDGEALNSLIST